MLKQIRSVKNEVIKNAKSLQDKATRNIAQQVLVEGKKNIMDLVAFNQTFVQLFFSEEFYNSEKSFVDSLSCEKFLVTESVLNALSTMKTPQGVIGVVAISKHNLEPPQGNVLILDGIQDAGNMGTILRTALATNFLNVILIDCVDVFNAKVINSSMTAIFKLNIMQMNYADVKQYLEDNKIKLLVADLDGVNVFDLKMQQSERIALVIGNEGNGVSENMRMLANKIITLPMNKNIESLNASVSAGILMYLIEYAGK